MDGTKKNSQGAVDPSGEAMYVEVLGKPVFTRNTRLHFRVCASSRSTICSRTSVGR